MFSIISCHSLYKKKVSVHVLAWDLPFNEKSLNFEILSHFEDEYNNVQNFRYNAVIHSSTSPNEDPEFTQI